MKRFPQRFEILLTFLFIGVTFMLTSSAFITWYLKVAVFLPSKLTDSFAEVATYLFHIVGMLIFSRFLKKNTDRIWRPGLFLYALILWFVLSLISVATDAVMIYLIFGFLAAIVNGIIFGYYLTALSVNVPIERRGTVFGTAGALSCIGTYLISLPMNGEFIVKPGVWGVYLILVAISAAIGCYLLRETRVGKAESSVCEIEKGEPEVYPEGKLKKYVLICATAIVLLSMVTRVGFYFPPEDFTQAVVNLPFSRAFYAIGLIVAGLLHDKGREIGFIFSSSAILFPVVSLLLSESLIGSLAIWIMAYIILGFVSVSRILFFADAAGGHRDLLYLASMGYVFGRLGEVVGTLIGVLLDQYRIIHIVVTCLICVVTLIFMFYLLDYMLRESNERKRAADLDADLIGRYELSPRELEVLNMVLDGKTNKEIAHNLYISDNTVKFHVKNIYKKTGCTCRKELRALAHR